MSLFNISRLCTPASIYFWLATISLVIVFLGNKQIVSSLISFLLILFWSWCLNMLCSKGYRNVSWVLVATPLIFMAYQAMKNNRSPFLL